MKKDFNNLLQQKNTEITTQKKKIEEI